jgi:hypothetical protein
MIHQFVFAGPKPGMTAADFRRYWVEVHAVRYASRIPQIRQYLVATREPSRIGHDVDFFEGVAEIWLANEEEQLASLQSPEFVDGARVDEPRWAAFWRTFVLDAESKIAWDDGRTEASASLTKVYTLIKRAVGFSRHEFARHLSGDHAAGVRALPGLRRHIIGLARDDQYGFGEPRFDAIDVWSFDDRAAVERATTSHRFVALQGGGAPALDDLRFTFVGTDHWIIRPGERSAIPAPV